MSLTMLGDLDRREGAGRDRGGITLLTEVLGYENMRVAMMRRGGCVLDCV